VINWSCSELREWAVGISTQGPKIWSHSLRQQYLAPIFLYRSASMVPHRAQFSSSSMSLVAICIPRHLRGSLRWLRWTCHRRLLQPAYNFYTAVSSRISSSPSVSVSWGWLRAIVIDGLQYISRSWDFLLCPSICCWDIFQVHLLSLGLRRDKIK